MSDEHDPASLPAVVGERHRPIMRRIHQEVARRYGTVGALSLGAASLPLALWAASLLQLAPGLSLSLACGSVTLLLARRPLRERNATSREALLAYCKANELEPEALLSYARDQGGFDFVLALFESGAARDLQEHKG